MRDQIATLTLHEDAATRTLATSALGNVPRCGFERAERFILGLQKRAPRRRHLNWVLSLHELEDFVLDNDRLPSRRAQAAPERALAGWVRRQRDRTHLTTFQRARLDRSPAFVTSSRDAGWMGRATLIREVILATGEPPRWLEADPTQYRLREWWTRQLHALRAGSLDSWRTVIIADLAELPARMQGAGSPGAGDECSSSAGISTTSAR